MKRGYRAKTQRKRGWNLRLLGGGMLLVTVCLLLRMYTINTERALRVNCDVPWDTIPDRNLTSKLCMTSLSDANVKSVFSKRARRDFTNVLDATWDNRVRYSQKHGYRLFNGSHLVNTSRPPAWSKILAAQDALKQDCEWVFWMDPDALIMNSEFKVEQLIPTDPEASLVITLDVTGFNAASWLVRNDPWGRNFLAQWWSMESFIRRPGDTKSGDNDALKALLNGLDAEDRKHVFVPKQCSMNSYLWTFSFKAIFRYYTRSKWVSEGVYRPGHFILHFGGLDDKMRYINKMKAYAF